MVDRQASIGKASNLTRPLTEPLSKQYPSSTFLQEDVLLELHALDA